MRTLILGLVALTLFTAGPAATAKDSDDAVVAGEIGAALDAVVASPERPKFWGAVLVARGGEILLAKGYGFADYAEKPNTPRTLFEIASASKQFTAAAILRLEEQRKLSTTDPLSKFFPDAPEEAERDGDIVVLRLHDGATVPLLLRMPPGAARGLAASIENAIAAREKDDPGGPPAMEGGLYLLRYGPLKTKLEISEGLTVRVQPMYVGQDREGNRIEDRRAVLIVDDTKSGQWPAMVKMNVAAARLLLAELRDAAK